LTGHASHPPPLGFIQKINANLDNCTIITNIKNQLDSTIIKVQEKAPKLYRKELVELLFEQPYSKIEFVVNKLGVERKAASRYLKELEDIGIVESQKIGRETLYINKELIEILKKQCMKS
jgi:Fic family protein